MPTITGIITRYPYTTEPGTKVRTATFTVEFHEPIVNLDIRGGRVTIEVPDTPESLLREVWSHLGKESTRYSREDLVDLKRRIAKHFGEEI